MELFALFAGNSRLMTGAALAFVGPFSAVLLLEHCGPAIRPRSWMR
jgi:hypothetical protein